MDFALYAQQSVVGGTALATFAGFSYLILQQLVKRPPTKAPQAP
ncbi:MAG: hypothetical protein K0Q50_2740, partial [Vampirovibrio sp.]|nr:hypothetical protein [Vampirovibrio sp.]